jgi:transcription elongation factor Elf1
MTQKDPKKTQKDPKRPNKITDEYYNCNYCGKEFSTFAHKRRHETHRCKENFTIQKQTIKSLKEEKAILYKQIDKLIDKAGNTTINTQSNNINLNSYGKEDLSHITDSFKSSLLKIPFGMIPKMIEAVHFNPGKPENNNITLPNKKEKTIKIFRGNKWIYRDKDDVINDLLDGKYFILDTYYDKVSHNMNNFHTNNYEKFKSGFDEYDKELLEKLKKECELILLNNR